MTKKLNGGEKMVSDVSDILHYCGQSELLDINEIAEVFYAHQTCLIAKRHIHPTINRKLSYFSAKLAEAMFDFATLACLGELRHSSYHIASPHKIKLYRKGTLEKVYLDQHMKRIQFLAREAYRLSPVSILENAVDLFGNFRWETGFGGNSWLEVAEKALRYLHREISDVVFVDAIFHITHNGGHLFDKDIIFYNDSVGFRFWLTKRAEGYLDDYFLENINQIVENHNDIINKIIAYTPFEWGGMKLYYDVIENYKGDEDDTEEEYTKEEESNEEDKGQE